jgi:hypothetical protein
MQRPPALGRVQPVVRNGEALRPDSDGARASLGLCTSGREGGADGREEGRAPQAGAEPRSEEESHGFTPGPLRVGPRAGGLWGVSEQRAAPSRGDEAAVRNGSSVVVALRPAPHEPVGVGLVSRHQGGVERCGEARVVEHQAGVVVAAVAGLAPPGAELEAAGVDAEVGLVVTGLRADRNDAEARPDGGGAERALAAGEKAAAGGCGLEAAGEAPQPARSGGGDRGRVEADRH